MSAATAERPLALASAGVAVVGVTFGMARYGFGLLAPDIRASFSLSSSALGVLAAASYAAYLVTSVAAGALTARAGARLTVAAGGLLAAAGMTVAGLATGPGTLFAGLLIAGSSAGLVFPPFSDVVARRTEARLRPRVLAAISAGTGWGICVAAPIALAVGESWRTAWLLFAALAAAATAWAVMVLPPSEARGDPIEPIRLSWFVCPRSGPLLAGAAGVGLASSAYWTFAVDYLDGTGHLGRPESRAFLIAVGLASVAGTVSGDLVRRVGGRLTFALALAGEAAALVLLGFWPGNLVLVAVSALLFGAAYNVVVAVQVIWSARVYEARPSTGLAAIMAMLALGLLLGPPLLGALADAAGFRTAFALAAVLALATAALGPRERLP